MRKVQWKRWLAAVMAFMLFVADAPVVLAQTQGSTEQNAANLETVSGNELNLYSGTDAEAEMLELDVTKTLAVTSYDNPVYYQFTPESTGRYVFSVSDYCGMGVYDENQMLLDNMFYYLQDNTYVLSTVLEAGKTYSYVLYQHDETVVSTEARLTKIPQATAAEVVHDKDEIIYYYGIDYAYPEWVEGLKVILSLENGEQLEVVPCEDNWFMYGINYVERTSEGEVTSRDENGYTPAGEYRWEITVPDLEQALILPYKVIDFRTVATSLTVDSTYTANIEKDGQRVFYQFTPTETGTYTLSASEDIWSYIILFDDTFSGINSTGNNGASVSQPLEAGRTYYYSVTLADDTIGEVDLQFTKKPVITGFELITAPGTTYCYPLDEPDISGAKFKIILDNGEDVEISVWDENWYNYALTYEMKTVAGGDITRDENNRVQTGSYQWEITVLGCEEKLVIPFTVVDVDDVAVEMSLDTAYTVSIDTPYQWVWYQFTPTEAGTYVANISSEEYNTSTRLYSADNFYIDEISCYSGTLPYVMEAGKTYYYAIRRDYGETGSTELRLTKVPTLVDMELLQAPGRTSFVYGMESPYFEDLKVKLIMDNQEELEVSLWDNVWYQFGMGYTEQTLDGKDISWDDSGRIPVGQYQWKVTAGGIEKSLTIPFAVVDVQDVATTLALNTEYSSELTTNGQKVWYQFTPSASGRYGITLSSDSDAVIRLYNSDRIEIATHYAYTTGDTYYNSLVAGKTYYYSVEMEYGGTGRISLQLSQGVTVTDIKLLQSSARSSYVYLFESPYIGYVELQVTLSDGQEITVGLWDENWNKYGLDYNVKTSTGADVSYDEYGRIQAGDYCYVITADGTDAKVTIPFAIEDVRDTATRLVQNTICSVDITTAGQRVWYQFTPAETGLYGITTSEEEFSTVLYLYDSNGENLNAYSGNGFTMTNELEAGKTYYCVAMLNDSSATGQFDIQLTKEHAVVGISLLKAPRTSFAYIYEGYDVTGLSVSLTLDDGQQVAANIWDGTWDKYGLSYQVSADSYDEEYRLMPGEYQWDITVANSTATLAVPFTVVDIRNTATVLATDTPYTANFTTPKQKIWYQFTPEEDGAYGITPPVGVQIWVDVYNAEGEHVYSEATNGTTVVTNLVAGENYYYAVYMCGENSDGTGEVALQFERVPRITSLLLDYKEGCGAYYYGYVYSYDTPYSDMQVTYTMDNDTQGTVDVYSRSFYDLGLWIDIRNVDSGEYGFEIDDNFWVLPGEYEFTVTADNGRVSDTLILEVREREEMPALTVGQSMTGLPGRDTDDSFFKLVIEEAGAYSLTPSVCNDHYFITYIDESGIIHYTTIYDEWIIQASGPLVYYIKFQSGDNADTYDLTLRKAIEPTALEVISINDCLLYGFNDNNAYNLFKGAQFKLQLSDGTEQEMIDWDDTWNKYDLNYRVCSKNGAVISNYSIPKGEYQLTIYSETFTSFYVNIPFSVVSANTLEKVETDETITVKPGETAIYQMVLPASGVYQLEILDGTAATVMFYRNCYDAILSRYVQANGNGTQPFGVNADVSYILIYNQNPDKALKLVIHKLPEITSLSYEEEDAVTFKYGSWGYYIGESVTNGKYTGRENTNAAGANIALSELVSNNGSSFWFDITVDAGMSDGSIQEIFYNSWLWNAYKFIEQIWNTDGSEVYTDENGYVAIGDYVAEFTANGHSVEVPFSVTESATVKDIRKTKITFAAQTYTGKALTPVPTVTYNGTALVKGKDYTITYSNNTKVGTATATLKGIGKYSGTVKTTFAIKENITAPSISSVSNTSSGVLVKWGKVSGATGYEVYRKTGSGSYSKIATISSGSTVEYTDKKVTNNTAYTYAVKAVKGSVVSCLGSAKSITFLTAPALSKISNQSTGVQITWGKVSGATGYEVYRKTGSGSYSKIATITSGSTVIYTDKKATNNTAYTYAVKAVKGSAVSSLGSAKSITFLTAPAISAANSACAQVKITWGKVSGATGYEVYRKTGSGSYSKIATISSGSTVSYTDKTAKVGTKYTYTVLTVKSGTKSAYQTTAKSVTVKDHSYENVVTKATTKKNGSVKKTCETCGKVASTTTINKIKTVTLANTEYTYTGKAIKPKVTVKDSKGNTINSKYYTVTYKNNKNVGKATVTITFKGNYSGTVTKTFTIKPKGTKISNLTATSKGFTVKWSKQKTQVSGYEIQYSTNKNFTSSTTKTVTVGKNTTVSQKVKSLKGNTKYFVRIRTYKTVKIDGKSTKIYSDWSAVKTIKTKK